MIEPNNQKVYFLSSNDMDELFPDARDAESAALDILEKDYSYIDILGTTIPFGYVPEKDAFVVDDSNADSNSVKKAHVLMGLLVTGELFDSRDIEKENGFIPDDSYPMTVNFSDGDEYHVTSYYPSLEQMANVRVDIWSGSGYTLTPLYIQSDRGVDDAEGCIELAVVLAEKVAPGLLLDVDDVEDDMAKDGHYDTETGEGDDIFQETYYYVDATMAGADRPYYIRLENLGIHPFNGVLS